jgi:L-talarate/galactarate dehydratase
VKRETEPGHPDRIVAAESWLLRFPYHHEAADDPSQAVDLIGVEIRTSSGTCGMGFTYSLCGGGRAVRALIDDCLVPMVVGRALADRWRLWDELSWSTRRLGPGVTRLAQSAVDIALWDAAARAQQVPLHVLLGTRQDRVPLFSSGRFSPALGIDVLTENAKQEVNRGARAIKLRIGGRRPAADLERVQAVRDAIGDVELFVDAAELLAFDEAAWLCPRLELLGITCLEEPFRAERVQQYRELRARTAMAIAGGEHLYTRGQVLDYLRAGAVDVLNPDVAIVGGITEFMRICELADAFGCRIAPHLVTDLHVAIAPAIPGLLHVENFPFTQHLWQRGGTAACAAALMPASTSAGHGLALNPQCRYDFEVGASHA